MNNDITLKLADLLKNSRLRRGLRVMEICGTHTTEFFRTGVKDIFPAGLSLIDGPGCPVCVTPNDYLDRAIQIGREHAVIISTFGDMMKVPSSYSSLAGEKSAGMDIRVVYSPSNALRIAAENPDKEVIFLSVGFETTAPSTAAVILEAQKNNMKNFSILSGNKLTPPALEALLSADEVKIDGFIIPGHVSTVIGSDAWNFIAEKHGKPGVVTGFTASDLIAGMLSLISLIEKNEISIKNAYTRAVSPDGNTAAAGVMYRIFGRCDAVWRGIGLIPSSGLVLKEEFAAYDSAVKFPVQMPPVRSHPGCRCGDLLRGLIIPTECPLFGGHCTPENAVGPCMVSSEGPCSAYYKYGGPS